jgi:hypothetical protein
VTFECALDEQAFSVCESPTSYDGLAEGAHTFHVLAVHGLQEIGRDAYSWTVDATPPSVTIRNGPFLETSDSVARFEFDIDDPSAVVECRVDDAAFSPCTSPYTTPALAPGSHTFAVLATDAATNTALVTYAWTVTPLTVTAIDVTPPDAADALDFFVTYRYAELTWLPPADADFDHVTVYRVDGAARRVAVYSGTASRYVARRFNNAVDHHYEVVSFDHAKNASPAAKISISASALISTPRRGARVRRPPALRWAPIGGARFYNVQLFRNGRKILSTWPQRPRVQLAPGWRYQNRPYKLTRGTYEWWVWPAFRRSGATRYGPPLGHSSFVKR